DFRRDCSADAVDRPKDVRFPKLGGGATELVPTSGVDDDERAVGILDHIGGVEISVIGNKKIGIGGVVSRAGRIEDVAGDFVKVEQSGEEIIAIIAAEAFGFVAGKA